MHKNGDSINELQQFLSDNPDEDTHSLKLRDPLDK